MASFKVTGSDRRVLDACRIGSWLRFSGEKTYKLVVPGQTKTAETGHADCLTMIKAGLFEEDHADYVPRAGYCIFYRITERGIGALESGRYGYR